MEESAPVGVIGWQCAVCAARVGIDRPMVSRCPNATVDDPHHCLRLLTHDAAVEAIDEHNPFLAYQSFYAWDAFAAAHEMFWGDRRQLVLDTDRAVADVAGTGFVVTPFARADALSNALHFSADGGVWVKDETRNVAGSHKARHLFSTLLALLVAEQQGGTPWGDRRADRAPLAIASCGNAALAAATLAAAVDWPIRVFVPPDGHPVVIRALRDLSATITVCPRRTDDPPGDPCVLRSREAVAAGAVPFGVQGPENAWCLDGGRSIGWEMSDQFAAATAGAALDRLFIQVGGGAFAHCAIEGFIETGRVPRLHAVQAQGCAPLARAWERAQHGDGGLVHASQHWAEYMTPWETTPVSAADGILDDETHDWLGVVEGMAASEGSPIVASEADVLRAGDLARVHTTIDASHTGTAGLAGLLAARDQVGDDERVAVVFSGVQR